MSIFWLYGFLYDVWLQKFRLPESSQKVKHLKYGMRSSLTGTTRSGLYRIGPLHKLTALLLYSLKNEEGATPLEEQNYQQEQRRDHPMLGFTDSCIYVQ